MSKPQPLPLGSPFDGSTINSVIDYDESDPYMPYLYQLANGLMSWVDVESYSLEKEMVLYMQAAARKVRHDRS